MNFATFDLNLLRVLDAIFTQGTTVAAADKLGLTQSAVSNGLGRLRHSLNDQLFVRQGNRLVPTAYADDLRDNLRAELERIEMLLAEPAVFDPMAATGQFRISGSDFFSEILLPPLGDLLNKHAPGIRAQLIDLSPANQLADIEHGTSDLALVPAPDIPDWAASKHIFSSEFLTIARQDHPSLTQSPEGTRIPLDTFCDLSHVVFSPEGRLQSIGDAALAAVGRKRTVAMTVPFFSGVCRVVSESDIIAIVPEQLARKVAPGFNLKLLEPPVPVETARIFGVWHRKNDNAPMARWVRSQIFKLLEDL